MARTAARIYVPLDVSFFDDDKVIEAGEAAGWLFLNMMTKAKAVDEDGSLSTAQMQRLGVKGWERRAARLVAVGLVDEPTPGVFYIANWLKWNESKKVRADKREADRIRKAEAAEARRRAEEEGGDGR